MKASKKLSIEHVSIDAVHPDPRNPRLHSEKQVKQIAKSIKTFGFNTAIVVDRDGKIIAGHGRYLAAIKLNLLIVPVVRLEHLSPNQAKAFAIADNKLTENAGWSEELLGAIYQELSEAVDVDFSLDTTGFTMAEIDFRIEALSAPAKDDAPDPADEVPAVRSLAVSKMGDTWLLGRHRVHVGSALDPAAFRTLMYGKKADAVFTDPPYNVKINGHATGKGKVKHREFAMASGEMSSDQFTDFLSSAFSLMTRHSKNGSIHYVCMDWRHLKEAFAAGTAAFTEMKNICIWVKSNAGMGSFYRSRHEMILVFKNGTGKHINNVELGRFGRSRSNVWEFPGANTGGRHGEEGNLLAIHPTVKPVAMIAEAILDCSARGEVVLDPFLGSGSALLAAERVGRACFGIEIDALYVDSAIRRWQKHTGDLAIHAESNKAFDEGEDKIMADKPKQDDIVGYKNPPKRTRFKKGQSGNPAGRPKKRVGFAEAFKNALGREIAVQDNGKTARITVLEALVQTIVTMGLKRNERVAAYLMKLIPTLEPQMREAEDKEESKSSIEDIEKMSEAEFIVAYRKLLESD